jgi:hypothetical protein
LVSRAKIHRSLMSIVFNERWSIKGSNMMRLVGAALVFLTATAGVARSAELIVPTKTNRYVGQISPTIDTPQDERPKASMGDNGSAQKAGAPGAK